MLEMIFRIGAHASVKLLENRDGDYHARQKIKPKLHAHSFGKAGS